MASRLQSQNLLPVQELLSCEAVRMLSDAELHVHTRELPLQLPQHFLHYRPDLKVPVSYFLDHNDPLAVREYVQPEHHIFHSLQRITVFT